MQEGKRLKQWVQQPVNSVGHWKELEISFYKFIRTWKSMSVYSYWKYNKLVSKFSDKGDLTFQSLFIYPLTFWWLLNGSSNKGHKSFLLIIINQRRVGIGRCQRVFSKVVLREWTQVRNIRSIGFDLYFIFLLSTESSSGGGNMHRACK